MALGGAGWGARTETRRPERRPPCAPSGVHGSQGEGQGGSSEEAVQVVSELSQAAALRPCALSLWAPACLWAPGERLRALSGTCGLPSRLAPLHQLLQPMASCARVVQCAEAVPTLLQAFFSAVTQVSLLPGCSVPAAGVTLGLRRAGVLEHRSHSGSARGTGRAA